METSFGHKVRYDLEMQLHPPAKPDICMMGNCNSQGDIQPCLCGDPHKPAGQYARNSQAPVYQSYQDPEQYI